MRLISVKSRIIAGFVLLLFLLSFIVIQAYRSLQNASSGFLTYQELARDANFAAELRAKQLQESININEYIITGRSDALVRYEEARRATEREMDVATQVIRDSRRARLIAEAKRIHYDYTRAFDRIRSLQRERGDLAATMRGLGKEMITELGTIVDAAYDRGDMAATYYAWAALGRILRGRLLMATFLDTNDEASAQAAKNEFQQFESILRILVGVIRAPDQRKLLVAVRKKSREYLEQGSRLVAVVLERNETIHGSLDKLSPQIAKKLAEVKQSVQDEQETLGPRLEAVNRTTLGIVLTIGLVSVFAGLVAAFLITGSIVGPLSRVTEAADRVASGDLDVRIEPHGPTELAQLQHSVMTMLSTIREKIAETEEANRAKSDFLARMSHEIRTPMNAVMGMCHLVLQTELSPKQQDYVGKIHASAADLLGIINDILDFSKIEAGKLVIDRIPFRLDDVLEKLADLITGKAEEKGLEVVFSAGSEVPQYLVGDPLRLGQILTNLANNAVKFTHEGEIVVGIDLLEQNDGEVDLEFRITDSGIGMTEEQQARLFQSFSQADGSITREYGGSGLGLAICKRLVELMGGRIHVASLPGKGSTFSFSITLRRADDESFRLTDPFKNLDLRGKRVLVVDDNRSARESLTSMLASQAFQVSSASSAEEALPMLSDAARRDEPFQLILMDWKMPGLDGLEASRRIKTDHALSQIPKILMVTAYGREEVLAKDEEQVVDGLLVKPVSQSYLYDKILEIFDEKPMPNPRKAMARIDTTRLEPIRGARVLLAEDNALNRQVALELLRLAEVTVDVAENGLKAVEMVQVYQYDLVLMDIQMPEMDGLTATRHIRRIDALKDLPVVAMTAHAIVGDREKSLAAGMNDHVAKPVDPDELYDALLRWIRPASRSAPEPTAQPEHDDLELPQIDGVDTAAGLRSVAGNVRLYLSLLRDFHRDYGRFLSGLEAKLTAKDYQAVQTAAHTIKGIAGTIGAVDLYRAAMAVESNFKKGRNDKAVEHFSEFARTFAQLISGLARLPSEDAGEDDEGAGPEIEKAGDLMARLKRLLQEDDSLAEDILPDLTRALRGAGVDDELHRLTESVEDLEYDDALTFLERISDKLRDRRVKEVTENTSA